MQDSILHRHGTAYAKRDPQAAVRQTLGNWLGRRTCRRGTMQEAAMTSDLHSHSCDGVQLGHSCRAGL